MCVVFQEAAKQFACFQYLLVDILDRSDVCRLRRVLQLQQGTQRLRLYR